MMQIRRTSDRQHAAFAIARFLEALKLPGWTQVLMIWMGQYDGMECYMEPDEDPLSQVRNLLARYLAGGIRGFPKIIAADLSTLPFLHYRAKLTRDTNWDPLTSSFIEFAQHGNVEVWRSDAIYPESAVTQAYLLAAYMRYQSSG